MAHDGGPWRGPTTEEWVERIARGSTPVREYVDGKFQPWISPASRPEQPDLARVTGTHAVRRDAVAQPETPDNPEGRRAFPRVRRPSGSPVEVPSLAPTGADLS